jgi:hypothetical protein
MVTRHWEDRPEIFYEYEEEMTNRRRTCHYCIDHGIDALTVLLFGLGILCFFVGLCTDILTVGQGIVGGVALGVLAYTIRVYFVRWLYSDQAGSRTEEKPTPEVQDQPISRYVWDGTKLAWIETKR